MNLNVFFSPSANDGGGGVVEMTLVWSNAQWERLINARYNANNEDDRTLQGFLYIVDNTWR